MEKRLLFLLVNLFLLCGGALAQTKVTGTVVSQEDGEPVIGASVVVAGAARTGTVTDIDGHFSLEVPAGKKLVVSYVGMQSQTLTPAAKMTIRLKADSKSLGEVVVTGMQKMDKRLFTGATTKISGDKTKLDGVADISLPWKVRLPVCLCRMYQVLSVQLQRFVCVVLLLFMVVQNLFGW